MDCPRCAQKDVTQDACPRCGVVFAKLRSGRPRPPAPAPPSAARRPGRAVAVPVLGGLLLAAGGLVLHRGRSIPAPPGTPARESRPETRPPTLPVAAVQPPPRSEPPAAQPPTLQAPPSGLLPEDQLLVDDLFDRLAARGSFAESDVRDAEALYARHAEEHGVPELLGAVLLAAGAADAQGQRLDSALARLRRAQTLLPGNRAPLLAQLQVLLDLGDWPSAEAAGRELLAQQRDPDVLERVALALFRQDRNREAAELLRETLELRPTPSARSLLERILKTSADERGMTEQQLSHFHVRYDGDAHEDVGREILRVLERHFAALAGTLDHRPATAIPVILFSRQQYYDASGAPAWSGGVYEPIDGRIRVPIGGLTVSLTPELERTLIHEVAHAFLADRTRGLCPREVHEGFAQYVEGKRIADELTPAQLTSLADGRIGGVAGFYLQALSFVEYLLGARGQGGINDLLREIGATRDVDEAFRRVYGADQRATRQAWLVRLRQQHGS